LSAWSRPPPREDDVAAFYPRQAAAHDRGLGGGRRLRPVCAHRSRAHIVHHIPGSPGIIVQNQPAAGGRGHDQTSSTGRGPKDGTVIGVPINGLPTARRCCNPARNLIQSG